jgi:hypothetical protein
MTFPNMKSLPFSIEKLKRKRVLENRRSISVGLSSYLAR